MIKTQVSVIIPCHNGEATLTEALSSLDSQGLAPDAFEIIVVDDGSTDHSVALIQKNFPGVKIIQQTSCGASAARNRGTREARGEYIQYLDCDDYLGPGKIEAQLKALQNKQADVAYSDWQKFVRGENNKQEMKETVSRKWQQISRDPEVATLTDFWAPPAALLYSRKIVEKIGDWKENLKIIQDARFLQDAAHARGDFVYVPGVKAYYASGAAGSLSRKDPVAFNRECYFNAVELYERWREKDGLTEARKKGLARVLCHTMRPFYVKDRALFNEALSLLERLEINYKPFFPPAIRLLAAVIGYPQAEAIAAHYRRLKPKAL